ESLLVGTDQSQVEKILAVFRKYIIMDKVELANISDKLTAIGIAGPKARESLRAAELEIPALEPLQLVELRWNQIGLTLVRDDNEFVESFEFLLAPENADQIYQALVKAGARSVGTAALEL